MTISWSLESDQPNSAKQCSIQKARNHRCLWELVLKEENHEKLAWQEASITLISWPWNIIYSEGSCSASPGTYQRCSKRK